MKKNLYILSILVFGITYSQENKPSDCDLQLDNDLWKIEYEKAETKTEQVKLIKRKIKADSIYTQFEPRNRTVHSATIINDHVDTNGTKCGCKILFALNYKKRKAIILDLNEQPELSIIVKQLNSENVERIWHEYKKETAQALYGLSGKCGFVQLRITDRKLKRLIKNVL